MTDNSILVAALYHFAKVPDIDAVRGPLQALCDAQGIKGSLLVAHEGINGTVAGSRAAIDKMLNHIKALPGFSALEHKESSASEMPFLRMKVKHKREIVTMGQPLIDPNNLVGTYIEAQDWNDLITQDDVVVIDTRNDYEVAIGSFDGAIDPLTSSFREFPNWWQANKERFHNKRIAMFCTGGIRCEKASSYLLSEGVPEVFHLKGGILKYLEEVPSENSRWQGDCFVFDGRVSLRHGLEEGDYELCYACRQPVSPQERQHEDYEKGVSCPNCIGEISDARRVAFRERQKQIRLAQARGENHMGAKER